MGLVRRIYDSNTTVGVWDSPDPQKAQIWGFWAGGPKRPFWPKLGQKGHFWGFWGKPPKTPKNPPKWPPWGPSPGGPRGVVFGQKNRLWALPAILFWPFFDENLSLIRGGGGWGWGGWGGKCFDIERFGASVRESHPK